ncbi:hypothetical protein JTB14_010550 [Gonioctena quinquepunctata]|nr:hypothetical protein JTB14_010550 [Gonioctena quinquepunctata]
MRRVSRISRVVTDIDVSKESQLRADAEEDRIRKARKRKKKLSPELQISKNPSGMGPQRSRYIENNIKPQEPLEKYVEAKNKMPRTELKHMKQFENKPENTVEILKTQKELNLLLGDIRKEAQRRTKEAGDRIQSKLDEDKCNGIPYIKLAEARLKTLYDHWLEVLTEEHKNEIEYLEARIKVIAIPKGERRIKTIEKFPVLIKQIGKQKETGKQEEKRKLEILNKRDSISSSFKIPTENGYGVLAREEHTQESANDTDAEAKSAKITDSQKRAKRRKKKKFRDMGNEQANEQGQIEPGNVTDSKKAPPKKVNHGEKAIQVGEIIQLLGK